MKKTVTTEQYVKSLSRGQLERIVLNNMRLVNRRKKTVANRLSLQERFEKLKSMENVLHGKRAI